MAILLACFVERALLSWTPRVTWSAFGGVVTAFSIGWIVYVDHYLPEREPAREQRSFAMRVREHVSHPNMVLLFRAEAHELIFHLGRPFDRLMEWENLDIWACQPTPVYVIMTLKYAAERREHLEAGKLYPLLIQDAAAGRDPDDRFVLLCTKPPHS
jgi:hypothetical protein